MNELSPEQIEELLAPEAKEAKPSSDAFSFWGAKKPSKKEAASSDWKDTFSSSTADNVMKSSSARKASKLADRLKAFEAPVEEPEVEEAPLAPPPPPEPTREEKTRSKRDKDRSLVEPVEEASHPRKHKSELPGSFPEDDDEIVGIIDMSPGKKSSKKSKKRSKEDVPPEAPPPPPPPPAVPDAPQPLTPPPEDAKPLKKERTKINCEGSASWGMWNAATPATRDKEREKEKRPSRTTSERKSRRSPTEKEEKGSSKGSASDKAERVDRAREAPGRPKLMSMFSTPPVSRSTSTRDKRLGASA
ncbi:hypothetical protein BN1723_019081, partial [Verticillium longisporum]